MAEALRILHYINQFYGGIGGEDKASVGLSAKDGPVGPGMLMMYTSAFHMRKSKQWHLL